MFVVLLVAMLFTPAIAQQQAAREPHIGYAYPAGAQQGATLQVAVGGQYLDGVSDVRITGKGVTGTIIEHFKPLPPGQAAQLRDKLKELTEKRWAATLGPSTKGAQGAGKGAATATTQPTTRPVWTAEDEKMVAEIRAKLATFVRRPSSPAIAETVTVELKVAPDAPPGEREIRLVMPTRLTDPMTFFVGTLPETSQPASRTTGDNPKSVAKREMSVTLPAVVNGQIMPGGIDRYRFQARKGQSLVLIANARSLIPYIADAVPGWFQATLTLFDVHGKEVIYSDDYGFRQDPVVHYVVPEDGEYAVEIHDSIYRGREDFVYRVEMGELPYVTSVFPLGGRTGTQIPLQLTGWNLAQTQVEMDARSKPASVYPLRGASAVNTVPISVDALPECMEEEHHDQPSQAQLVTLPMIINGRIDRPGDVDFYRFEGTVGEQIVADVRARRLGSPLDSVIEVTDSAGKQIAFNDDRDDKAMGLETHHADSYLMTKLPASGTYYLSIRDTQGKGGSEYGYRLRISRPHPDFELRVTPSSLSLRRWVNDPITVYAIRKDGFAGEIKLAFVGQGSGIKLSDARIPADKDTVKLTLTVPQDMPDGTVSLHLQGSAVINGLEVVRAAVPAEDMMQAFAYRHLVAEDDLLATVGRTPIAQGGTTKEAAAKPLATTKPSVKGK